MKRQISTLITFLIGSVIVSVSAFSVMARDSLHPTLDNPTPTPTPAPIFLPLITNNPLLGITGTVKYNDSPASGISLNLRHWDGVKYSTIATTTTVLNGNYIFANVNSLNSGQSYHVRFKNTTNSNFLSFWWTRDITSYTSGTSAWIGDFDIANVSLVSPTNNAQVTLPLTFQWVKRNTTSDSYFVQLFALSTPTPYWASPSQGYVNSYYLSGLPPGFGPNVQYGWDVCIQGVDGSVGESFFYRNITFASGSPILPNVGTYFPARRIIQDQIPSTVDR